MTPAEFAQAFDVSRETTARLEILLGLLAHWTARINLVAASTLPDAWARHIADSAQLYALAPPEARSWLDLGAGAGFPGLVITAIAAEKSPKLAVTLVESDHRKAAFLRTAAQKMALAPVIHAARAESLPPHKADVVSARALAPLPKLLALASPFVGQHTVCLFPKGAEVDRELTDAERDWHSRLERTPSQTHPSACILRLSELRARNERPRHAG